MKIQRIDHLVLTVRSIDMACAFYERILGMECVTVGQGRKALVFFGYTYCPDACPMDMTVLSQGLQKYAEKNPALAAKIQAIFITIDPERDTPQVLTKYVTAFHPSFLGLHGDPAATAALGLVLAEGHRLHVAGVAHGDDHVLRLHQIFVRHVERGTGDLGATVVAEVVADLGQLALHHAQQTRLAAQDVEQVNDLGDVALELLMDGFLLQPRELLQAHFEDGRRQHVLLRPGVALSFGLVALIWGSTWFVIKDQLDAAPPSWSITWRFVIAAVAMAALA